MANNKKNTASQNSQNSENQSLAGKKSKGALVNLKTSRGSKAKASSTVGK
jgi:ribosomal protein L27